MNKWYECQVRHTKQDDDGVSKKVTDRFYVEAISYTDAESRMNEFILSAVLSVSGDFWITKIVKSNVTDVIGEIDLLNSSVTTPVYSFDDHINYKVKVSILGLDADASTNKRTSLYMLVNGKNVTEVVIRVDEFYKDTAVDYEIEAVTKTPILDVFKSTTNEG